MKNQKWWLFALFQLVIFVAAAQTVATDRDAAGNLKAFRTFHVEQGDLVAVLPPDVQINKEAILSAIRGSLISELQSRGYQYTEDSTGAEMTVSFVAEIIQRLDVEDLGPLGQQPATTAAEMDRTQTWSQETRQGNVSVQLTAGRGENLWRGRTTVMIGNNAMEEVLAGAASRCVRKVPKQKK